MAGGARAPSGCRRCRGRRFVFRRATAAVRYGGVARDLVLSVKFSGRREGMKVLGERLAAAHRETGIANRASLVVPVPLHPWRRLWRGFDQAELLADEVSKRLERPVVRALRRRRATVPQATRPPLERRSLTAEAFAATWRARAVRQRAVLLVDDVMTSGATVEAASRALLAAGARVVFVGVAAT